MVRRCAARHAPLDARARARSWHTGLPQLCVQVHETYFFTAVLDADRLDVQLAVCQVLK